MPNMPAQSLLSAPPGQSVAQSAFGGNKQQVSNFMNALHNVHAGSNNAFMNAPTPPPQQQGQPLVNPAIANSQGQSLASTTFRPGVMPQANPFSSGTSGSNSYMLGSGPGQVNSSAPGAMPNLNPGGFAPQAPGFSPGNFTPSPGMTFANTSAQMPQGYLSAPNSSPYLPVPAGMNPSLVPQGTPISSVYNAPTVGLPTNSPYAGLTQQQATQMLYGGTAPLSDGQYSPQASNGISQTQINNLLSSYATQDNRTYTGSTMAPTPGLPTSSTDPTHYASGAPVGGYKNPDGTPNVPMNTYAGLNPDGSLPSYITAPTGQAYAPIQNATNVNSGLPLTTSDENLKDNINPANDKLRQFMQTIGAHNYTYKNPQQDGQGQYTSPMAQELANTELGKQAVVQTPRGLMVDYGRLGGVNLAAVSVLYKEQEKLRQQVQQLQKKLR